MYMHLPISFTSGIKEIGWITVADLTNISDRMEANCLPHAQSSRFFIAAETATFPDGNS